MDFSKFIDKIVESKSNQSVSVTDCPTLNYNKPKPILDCYPKWSDLCKEEKIYLYNIGKGKEMKSTPIFSPIVLSLCGIIPFLLACFSIYALNKWGEGNDKWLEYLFIFICFVSTLVSVILLFYKYIHYTFRKNEIEIKHNEKMIDSIVASFNEDRENAMLLTKSEISLYEKDWKARIDQWERIKEHGCEINKREQERIAKLSEVLTELAKVQNKVTQKDTTITTTNSKETKTEMIKDVINEKSFLTT